MTLEDYKKYDLPELPGVYFFKLGEEILYIGRATNLRDRVKSYFANDLISTRGPLIVDMVFKSDNLEYKETSSVLEAIMLEAELIKKYSPKYNTKEKDNKSYNNIVITDEDYPKVLIERKRNIESGKFTEKVKYIFGPYPSGSTLRDALNIIRKIIKFRDNKCKLNSTKACFNYSIKLCPGTCIGLISKKEYNKNIKRLKLFLEGNTFELKRELEKDMKEYAKEENFEKAGEIKKIIFAIEHIQDIALIRDEYASSLRIEAYDISHISGSDMYGAMIVYQNGEYKKEDYKIFKLKTLEEDEVNDIKALREILERRLKHSEWQIPDIFVVDGGETHRRNVEEIISKYVPNSLVVSVVKDDRHKARAVLGLNRKNKNEIKNIIKANAEVHRFVLKTHRKMRDKIK